MQNEGFDIMPLGINAFFTEEAYVDDFGENLGQDVLNLWFIPFLNETTKPLTFFESISWLVHLDMFANLDSCRNKNVEAAFDNF